MTQNELTQTLAQLVEEAERLQEQFAHYWSEDGENVSQLEIFIDPDLYQYIERMYKDSLSFFARVAALKALLDAAE